MRSKMPDEVCSRCSGPATVSVKWARHDGSLLDRLFFWLAPMRWYCQPCLTLAIDEGKLIDRG